MTKRRKHRRNQNKTRTRKYAGDTNANTINETSEAGSSVMKHMFNENEGVKITPANFETPVRNQKVNNVESSQKNENNSINTTPVYRRRCCNYKTKTCNASLNVTNLNILFDSNFVCNSPNITNNSDVSSGSTEEQLKQQINLNILNEHTPCKSNISSTISQGTQTVKPLDIVECEGNVMETPKINHVIFRNDLKTTGISRKVLDSPCQETAAAVLNNLKLCKDDMGSGNKFSKYSNGEVNINPYLQERDLFANNKDGSFGEMLFFSPKNFALKHSSTPINKLNKAGIANYLKDSLVKESSPNLVNNSFNIPKFEKDVSITMNSKKIKSPSPNFSEKVVNVEANEDLSMSCQRNHSLHISKRHSYRSCTPKVHRRLGFMKMYNKTHNFMYTRFSVMKRSTVELTDSVRRPSIGMCEKVFNRMKKYSKLSVRWSSKVVDLCSQLGLTLKNSLSSVCHLYKDRPPIGDSHRVVCKCEQYQNEVSNLNIKIQDLNYELFHVKSQLHELLTDKEELVKLSNEVREIREELSKCTVIRNELEQVKEEFRCMKFSPETTNNLLPTQASSLPPPAPSLPPPPPPPLPPLSFSSLPLPLNICPERKAVPKDKPNQDVGKDKPRPVISLDDILKVKLKKAADRPSTTPLRRMSQPVVSLEMLRQVKLKPASRPSIRSERSVEVSPLSNLTTSPHSSLCRLLNDNSVGKVKRLQRVGRYSFDSVSRRNLLGKRERSGNS